MKTRSLATLSARLLAVGFALGTTACLVINAQRRANPEPAPDSDPPVVEANDPAVPEALPVAVPAGDEVELSDEEIFLFTSKSLPPAALTNDDSQSTVFMPDSKFGVLQVVEENVTPTQNGVEAPPPTFLPSSKVLVVDTGVGEDGTPPVFLHSSKDAVLDFGVEDNFLRSSKSGVLAPFVEPAQQKETVVHTVTAEEAKAIEELLQRMRTPRPKPKRIEPEPQKKD